MKKNIFILLAAAFILHACSEDDGPGAGEMTLNISGLQDLGTSYKYEGWIIVDGSAVSTGLFDVDASGNLSETTFPLDESDLSSATAFVLTIEPSPDPDPAPSSTHILAGDFSGSNANLSIGHASAIGDDFSSSSGAYILATPTNGNSTDENSGVWWLDPNGGPDATLDLPTLPAGWKYEGWAVINGSPVTTGTFTSVDAADDSAPYSETIASAPPFPGEDFLINAPAGQSFPVDLSNMTIVVSVEPDPDNSSDPFLLKPLVADVPAGAIDHTLYNMMNNSGSTNPSGSASR